MTNFKDLKVGDFIYVVPYCCSEIRINALRKITIHRVERLKDNTGYRLKFIGYPYVEISNDDFNNCQYIKNDIDVLIVPSWGSGRSEGCWNECRSGDILYKYQINKEKVVKEQLTINYLGYYKNSEGDEVLITTKEGENVIMPYYLTSKDNRVSTSVFVKERFITGINSSIILYGLLDDYVDREFNRLCLDVITSNSLEIERLSNFIKEITKSVEIL